MKQSLVTTELKATGVSNKSDTMADNTRHGLPSNTGYKGHSMTRQMSRSCPGLRGKVVGQKSDLSYSILSFKFLRDNVYYFITAYADV